MQPGKVHTEQVTVFEYANVEACVAFVRRVVGNREFSWSGIVIVQPKLSAFQRSYHESVDEELTARADVDGGRSGNNLCGFADSDDSRREEHANHSEDLLGFYVLRSTTDS